MIGPIRPVSNHQSVYSTVKTEQCQECGKLYPASWIPSFREGGHACRVKSAYCSEGCRNAVKRRRQAAAYQAKKSAQEGKETPND
jgi:hypothetical protein